MCNVETGSEVALMSAKGIYGTTEYRSIEEHQLQQTYIASPLGMYALPSAPVWLLHLPILWWLISKRARKWAHDHVAM